jgi:hypothetical protein
MCGSRIPLLALALTLIVPWPALAQEASWLDGNMTSWNVPGMTIPAAPVIEGNPDPRCAERERPADTAEDAALMAQGWRLFSAYQRGWGVTLISGLAAYDGMCRPLGYQAFVFVDGVFAGTIAPAPMDSRTDGALSDVNLWFQDRLGAEFVRYTADDPLCCPSSTTSVQYAIAATVGGPVLNPVPPQ